MAEEALHDGEPEIAERHAHEVARIQALTLPAGHPDFGDSPLLLGRVAAYRGEPELAIAQARRALAFYERGADDERRLELRLEIAGLELALGRFAVASREYEVLTVHTPAYVSAQAYLGLAEIGPARASARGRPQAARGGQPDDDE